MPVPMRPIFDAENPMYCAPRSSAVRPSSFMRKLLRLQSAQESPLKARRHAGFTVSSLPSGTLASSQSSSNAADPAPPRILHGSPSRTTRRGPAPAIVLSKPMLGLLACSPPKLLVPAQTLSSLAVPANSFYASSTKKRKRASESDCMPLSNGSKHNKRARKSSGNASFLVSSRFKLPAFGHGYYPSSNIRSTSFPQPHFSAALPSPPYAPGSLNHRGENVLKTTASDSHELNFTRQCTDPEHLLAVNRVVELQAELYGFEPGAESQPDIEVFVDELARFVPDARLKQQLQPLSTLTHQDMATFLGEKGYFSTPTTLAMFRRANVDSIDLRLSLIPEQIMLTTNVEKMLEVFTHPESFKQLYELNLNDVPLTEESFMLLQPLRSTLQILWLKRTGTTDAMLPHLVCHRKLTNLRLTGNNGVTDEGVTNLLYMTALKYLELDHTRLTMDGLRCLAEGILSQERKVTLEIPKECDDYMNSLHTQYLVHPSAPLITDPGACGFLALPALKRNLAEHAKFNDAVVVKGSRGELCEALRAILERRRRDMMVRAVMWQRDDEETVRSGEPIDGEPKDSVLEDEMDEENCLYSA